MPANPINNSYGFIETRGLTAMLSAVDDMLKTSNIKLKGFKRYGSAYITTAIQGRNEDVLTAVQAAEKRVKQIEENAPQNITNDGLCQLISTYITARPGLNIIDLFFNKQQKKIDLSDNEGLAFIDARGLIALIATTDQITKSYPLEIMGYNKMGSGRLNLIIKGRISSLKPAVEMGIELVKKHGRLIGYSTIARPHFELKHILTK
ncbi:MAG: BMC domain-containing protein [Firmicutes bacterium]|nr:BMC domain-containing protein [Bacillota bacterium]